MGNISTRLIASFVIIIITFIGIALYYSDTFTKLEHLHSSNLDNIVIRSIQVMEIHQQFTEYRWFNRSTFFDTDWRTENETNEEVWRAAELFTTSFYQRILDVADIYILSVITDDLLDDEARDTRMQLMGEVVFNINTSFNHITQRFFWDGERTYNFQGIPSLHADTAAIIQELVGLAGEIRDEISTRIFYMQRRAQVTLTALFALIMSIVIVMAFSTIKSFRSRIKEVEDKVEKIKQGDFTNYQNGNNEISHLFIDVVTIFDKLISDIKLVTLKGTGQDFIDTTPYQGKYLEVALSVNNLTSEFTEIQRQEKESNERFRVMLDSAPIACFLITNDFVVLDCNYEASNLFGLTNKDNLNADMEHIVGTQKNHKILLAILKRALLNKDNKYCELELHTLDDKIIPCAVSMVSFKLGKEQVVAAYFANLTIIKAIMEEEKRALDAELNSLTKSKFLARMSHEIRTPISAVVGISEIQLQNSSLPLEVEEAFAKIYNSGQILLGIVNDILDLSKVEAGKMELINNRYEVASAIADTIQLNIVYIGSKQLTFVVDVDENMPAYLIGDELRIKQILTNLLSNAVKYTEKGSVTFMVSSLGTNDKGIATIKIDIIDTGYGMTKNQQKALFDEYSRFHEKESRTIQGIGLGMPIALNLLEVMGGAIEINSEVNKGTHITLFIPQQVDGDKTIGPETATNLRKFNTDSRYQAKKFNFIPEPMPYGRVLIVDDIETNLYVASGLIGLYKIQTETCNSGAAAIHKVEEGNVYDIIFMDQMMPQMNGTEAVAIIRKRGYTGPIVALTANALVGQAEEFLKNGFDGFLSKPIQTAHLNGVLKKFIKNRYPEEAAAIVQQKPEEAVDTEAFLKESGFYLKACKDFVRSQKDIIAEITAAAKTNDFKTAHRLAHTLKGFAGILEEKTLAAAAAKVEADLAQEIINEDTIAQLSQEVTLALAKIQKTIPEDLTEQPQVILDKGKAKELFDRLAKLLEANNFGALEFCEELLTIPQSAQLIEQIENVDFTLASKTLTELRKTLEV